MNFRKVKRENQNCPRNGIMVKEKTAESGWGMNKCKSADKEQLKWFAPRILNWDGIQEGLRRDEDVSFSQS